MTRGPVYEQNYKVYWLATAPGTQAAPTVAEITAGVYMGRLISKDGVDLSMSQQKVSTNSIDDLFDAERMGSWGMSPSLTIWRDDATETDGFDLIVFGTIGTLVIIPFGGLVATSKCVVIPSEMGVTQFQNSAANTGQQIKVDLAVHTEPSLTAVVAA